MSQQTVFNGRYELHRRLARGGMADVFLARDQLLDRPVAVKVLFPEYATDPSLHDRAMQIASRFNRPASYAAHDLALSVREGAAFWTADQRLYNAVRYQLPWVYLAGG